MNKTKNRNCHFYIEIKSCQNGTWHGIVETIDKQYKKTYFKSLLELIQFIDSQMSEHNNEK